MNRIRALVVKSLPLIAYGLVAVTVGLWVLSVFKPEWVG